MSKGLFRSILKIIVFTVALVLFVVKFDQVGSAISAFLAVLTPVFLGFAIAFFLHRPFAFFRRQLEKTRIKKAATPLAVVIAYLLFFAVVVALLAFIIPQIVASFVTFAGNFSGYFAHVQQWLDDLVRRFDIDFLKGINLPNLGTIIQQTLSSAAGMLSGLSVHVFSITSNVIAGVINLFLAFVFSVYMLSGSQRMLAQCRRLVVAYLPEKVAEPLLEVTRLTADTFTNFISGQLTEACILGSLCFLGMCLFRFEYAPLISVIVGVSALIPIVGPFLGAATSALLLAMISPVMAFWFLVFLITLQQLEGNIIYPRVVGKSIGLPGIWVLGAVTVGGGLFGFLGLLVAVPTASVLYTLIQRNMRRRLREREQAAGDQETP